jgi:hypothetical protein
MRTDGRHGAIDVVHRIPFGAWEHFEAMLCRMDNAFLQDVSRITKIPFTELRKVIPTRGVPTRITTEGADPWWTAQTCRMAVRGAQGMWIRCSGTAFEGSCCFKHRSFDGTKRRCSADIRPYNDPYFANLPRRMPVRIEGTVYWAGTDGILYNVDGAQVEGYTIDYAQGIVHTMTKN